jgi:hypothetical protein
MLSFTVKYGRTTKELSYTDAVVYYNYNPTTLLSSSILVVVVVVGRHYVMIRPIFRPGILT